VSGQAKRTPLASQLKQSANRALRQALGIEVHRAAGAGASNGAAGTKVLSAPSPEMLERVEGYYSVSFPLSPGCTLTPDEIERRIRSYYWHYTFQFGDRLVEAQWPPGKGLRSRHYQRYCHIFPALLSLTEGSLQGRTVLDIGCNCGFWSLQSRLAGAERVLGLEASEENVDQAKFILELTGLDRLSFEQTNAYDVSGKRHGEFDVVLHLGLLYHLEHPVFALERLSEVTREFAVVDTTVIPDHAAVCRVQPDDVHEQNYSNRLCMIPSSSAVVLMLRHAGFRDVFLVPKTTENLPPDYSKGVRETFIAVK
jgi:tRNA (mo5U34)-methyltransferase